MQSAATFHALRLEPGADLYESFVDYARQHDLHAAFVATCVGSLTRCTIRFANQPAGTEIAPGHYEIVSLVGTVAIEGCHLHICLSDGEGKCVGGHLLPGSSVYTTAEIVLGEMTSLRFDRKPCVKSGYDELAPSSRNEQP